MIGGGVKHRAGLVHALHAVWRRDTLAEQPCRTIGRVLVSDALPHKAQRSKPRTRAGGILPGIASIQQVQPRRQARGATQLLGSRGPTPCKAREVLLSNHNQAMHSEPELVL